MKEKETVTETENEKEKKGQLGLDESWKRKIQFAGQQPAIGQMEGYVPEGCFVYALPG